MDVQLIKKLIQLVNDNNVGELKIEEGDFKIAIKHKDFIKQQVLGTALPTTSPVVNEKVKQETPAPNPTVNNSNANAVAIKAPMIGTFYRSSGPDKEPFVKVGDKVKKGDVLCIIESMKLFNEIKSEVSGKVIKVTTDNAQAVEYDQVLFLIEP